MGLDIYFNKVRKQSENIGYFRKVNFLVGYFENYYGIEIQNCIGIKVSKEAVESLLACCNDVLQDHSKAEELLPCRSGFFFGSYEYNDYYFEDVKYVKEYCEDLLPKFEDLDDDEYIEFEIWF